jgi:transcription factor E
MLQKFLKETTSSIVGKQGEELIDLLDSKKYINEFLIAKKLDITINQARNILYRLSDFGLVSSIRKKDKRKGWYTYFWKIEVLRSLSFLRDEISKGIDQLEHHIKSRETKRFYLCERCNVEYTEENALAHNFTCEECGSVFVLKDNEKLVKDLRKELERLENQRREIDKEIQEEKEKGNRKRQKEIRSEAKALKARRKKSVSKALKTKKSTRTSKKSTAIKSKKKTRKEKKKK